MKFFRLALVFSLLTASVALGDEAAFSVSPVVKELSGGLWDSSRGVIWTQGDDEPVLGRTDTRSWKTEPLALSGMTNDDWEAMVLDSKSHLWILQSGDNRHEHPFRSAFEVDPSAKAPLTFRRRIDFIYPAGKLNVEAAVFRGEEIYLFEKSYLGRARIFSIDVSEDAPSFQIARQHGTIPPVGPITDAALAPDGTLYLLTYLSILSCRNCLDNSFVLPLVRKLSFWGQAETIFVTPSGALMVGAEDGSVYRVD